MFPDICPTHDHEHFSHQDEFPYRHVLINGFSTKNKLIGMHSQDFPEINIVLGGSGVHYINNNRLLAKTGDVFFILPNYAHGYMGNHDFEVFNIAIHSRFMAKYLTDMQVLPAFSTLFQVEPLLRASSPSPLHLSLNEQQLNSIRFLLSEISQHSYSDTHSEALTCNSLTIALICQLCNFYKDNVGSTDVHNNTDPGLFNALTLIHERYQESISIDTLAQIANLSRSAFIRKFQQICGMPPHKYLTKLRIETATHYLESTELPLLEIAEISGFYDIAHFSRIFKAETGISPTKYRKNHYSSTQAKGTQD